jgi:acyl-CoA dehydrogenase
VVDFAFSQRTTELRQRVREFVEERCIPAEEKLATQTRAGAWDSPPVLEELKAEARSRGLWNLFLPGERGAGLTNLEYAPLAEESGRSPWLAPEAMNCSAPDTGNMEILAHFAGEAVRRQWLEPLLDGRIRSAYSMTEPDVASSDANNIATRIEVDGDGFRVTGRKWWSSGRDEPPVQGGHRDGAVRSGRRAAPPAHDDRGPAGQPRRRGDRSTSVFGYDDGAHGGHAEIVYDDVRVPRENLLGELHGGFAIAQARLGPGGSTTRCGWSAWPSGPST